VRLIVATLTLVLITLFPVLGAGQTYPSKALRMIVPFPPGGAADLLGRVSSQKLSERMGQPVVVETRSGNNGNIGADLVSKSPPDGYTLMIGGVPHAINMSLYQKLPYSLEADLTAIAQLITYPSMIAVHPSLPVKSMKELIVLARSRPGDLNFGSSPGSPNHLAVELICMMANVKMVHIGYKGAGPAITDLVGGHLHLASVGLPGAMPHVIAGRLRPIAITSVKRAVQLPDLPTVSESGLPGFDVTSWWGVFGPARMPADIVSRVNAELRAGMESADVKKQLAAVGADVETTSSAEYARIVHSETQRWAKVVKASGATP
jgi:tripartite-type tricarboxylate transporter receptor subunit TctC